MGSAMLAPCSCHVLAMLLPRSCHALAMLLPCSCHALATFLPRSGNVLDRQPPQPQRGARMGNPVRDRQPPQPQRGARQPGRFRLLDQSSLLRTLSLLLIQPPRFITAPNASPQCHGAMALASWNCRRRNRHSLAAWEQAGHERSTSAQRSTSASPTGA